jgi:hypothetical protein
VLDGVRGRPSVQRDAVIDAVLAVANTASALGAKLHSLEINPLYATADRVEALDALVVLRDGAEEEMR